MEQPDGEAQIVPTDLRIRPGWRALRGLAMGALFGVAGGASLLLMGVDARWVVVVSLASMAGTAAITFRLIDRYSLEIREEGLVHRYRYWKHHDGGPGFRLIVAWDQVASIGPRRLGGVLPVRVLAVSAAAVLQGPDQAGVGVGGSDVDSDDGRRGFT